MGDGGFELSAAEEQIIENLPNAVGVYRYLQGQIVPVFLSKQFIKLFGYADREQAMASMNRDLYLHVHPDDIARVSECGYQFARGETDYDIVYRRKDRTQSEYHVIHAIGIHAQKGGQNLAYISYTDESRVLNRDQDAQIHLSESFLQNMSLENNLHRNQFDDLTGLPMIERFLQYAPEGIRAIRRQGKSPVMLWITFSGLREYETLHGFEKSDALIRGLAWVIRDEFGVRNTARFNSNCFVAYADTENLENALLHLFQVASNLNQGNSRPVSVGIYRMKEEGISLAAAIDRARLACDSLNEPLHSSYSWFNQQILARTQLRQYILQNYQKAMDNGWIRAYYQPVMRTVTGRLCGAEALCRWNDPVYAILSPGDFIPVLEEEGLISELDLYMVEQVCRDERELADNGMKIVPVSVNLSRKDFRKADLVEQIESIAKKYSIPRELLNIEITESAFINHPEKLSKYIDLFHELGYQVWMDDFGTAYSSLGALKDLNFDELKIDMSFLSHSTGKSRKIITSIVDMAKKIGIQTLAEGVETEEQYQFLKRIGCEKVQGYYFGSPMNKDTFRKQFSGNPDVVEELRWRHYYDAVSAIDFQTDQALCVIEDDGVTFRQLYTNDSYENVLRRDQIDGIDAWLKEINANNNPAHTLHRQYADEQLRKSKGPQVITYPSGDHYMELTGNTVTHYENRYIYAMHIRYIQLNKVSEDKQRAFYIQNIYYLCSDIAVFNLNDQTMYGLKSSDSSLPIGNGRKSVNLIQAVKDYAEKFIYAPDQQRFRSFFDIETLRKRMMQNSGQELTGFFRSLTVNSDYHWMIHMIMPIPKSDFRQYLVVTIPTGIDMDSLYKFLPEKKNTGVALSENGNIRKDELTPSLLWKNLETYAGGMYFWKDRNRRFLGASRSFLDFYGFRSPDEILGKTDEEMHWHVEPDAFRKDELQVLEQGKRVILAKGKCIARGKPHNILTSKFPVYRDGKIIGLMGIFFDAEPMIRSVNEIYQSASTDPVTGLLNTRGIAEWLRNYLEALWTDNMEFSMIYVEIPEYGPFAKRYGENAGRMLLQSIGDRLNGLFGKEGTIGRLTGSHFTILIQDTDTQRTYQMRSKVENTIGRLRKVGEWQCALTAQIRIAKMNQSNACREIYTRNLQELWSRFAQSDSKK